ncbi:NAD(P)-dependent oxidoreductase [Chelativorans sp. YIM 93263]|uniref:NAD(P)-dependent oxidoreductase n=1 Tax=Chelativorans sp. YIM 93263 TaxID=2906648 RepID=UPI002377E83E|nr:NAD(P)-dependent oxidoreductase [Chelativorans sp. YIM 93263]
MTHGMSIAFIGFGEAARAFQESLAAEEPELRFSAYDILLDAPGSAGEMRAAMKERGIEICDAPAGLSTADWVISAVTADQSGNAIDALSPHLKPGQLVIDINSVSPQQKRANAALVEQKGAGYLDMAVMAPVHPRKHRTPVLIAGASAEALRARLDALGFDYAVAGESPGKATAIKMVRSLFVKGLEAITVETLLAAEASDCFDAVYQSLSRDFSGLGWPDFAAYEFERSLRHGRRRAAEMRESAATVEELGLNGALATEIAEVQERIGRTQAPAPEAEALRDGIREVLRGRLEQETGQEQKK